MQEVWLSTEEVCELTGDKKETIRRKCKSGVYKSRFKKIGKCKNYFILLSSLPNEIAQKYMYANAKIEDTLQNTEKYTDAPIWAKKCADKYLKIFKLTEKLSYQEKLNFLQVWNNENKDEQISYKSLMRAKKKYEVGGIEALLSKYGIHRKGLSKIKDDYFEYFKSVYLQEAARSAQASWRITLGEAKKDNIDILSFPSCSTFMRRLKAEVPEQAIYLARYGRASWYKKYANYIPRDYSNVSAGAIWVSDHAQIDVAVSFDGNICFPWVTVFRDIKTSKWLGWFLHADSPNSDHIFQAFYYGILRFGLPEDVYLDNGKDYRCKDFAGGRASSVKVKHSNNETALLKNIGVNVHFALPYNAQTKPVERDFLKVKTFLSKFFVGYRGGKITERPEKLKFEIKNNQTYEFEEFKRVFDDFIENILNKTPSKGKNLQGMSPDELWSKEYTTKKVISRDALKLFCI